MAVVYHPTKLISSGDARGEEEDEPVPKLIVICKAGSEEGKARWVPRRYKNYSFSLGQSITVHQKIQPCNRKDVLHKLSSFISALHINFHSASLLYQGLSLLEILDYHSLLSLRAFFSQLPRSSTTSLWSYCDVSPIRVTSMLTTKIPCIKSLVSGHAPLR